MGRRRHASLRRVLLGLLSALLAEYLLVHTLPSARSAWRSVSAGAPILLGLGLCLELASILAYTGLTLSVLPRRSLRFRQALAIDVTGLGMSHVMPGGGATAAGLRVRLWTQRGVPTPAALGATSIEYAVNLIWLVAALLLGSMIAAPGSGTLPTVRVALLVSVVLILLIGAVVAVLVARPDWIMTFAEWVASRTPLLTRETLERAVGNTVDQARAVLTTSDRRGRAFAWGLASWGLDVTSLFVCLAAYGRVPSPGGVITTYALINLLALLPLTPGGLGVVEGTAVPALVSVGVAPTPALLGVLSWRLFQFWLPIPVGLGTFGWLSFTRSRRSRQESGSRPSADVAGAETGSDASDQHTRRQGHEQLRRPVHRT